ncbi:MAG: hypothetical protein AAFP19_21590, partial [Bacteroidota bacterium]
SKYVVVRKDIQRIRDTVLPTFEQIKPTNFTRREPTQSNGWEWHTTNGSVIKFYGENIEKDPELKRFRGLEYDSVCFEEMDIRKKTFYVGFERSGTWKMADRKKDKLEGKPIPPNIVVGTSNPQSGWVKEIIYDPWKKGSLKKNWHYIPSRVYDNPYVEQDWIEGQKRSLPSLRYKMMMDGDWEVNLNEKPFYYQFDRQYHVTDETLIPDPMEPIWLSFDFNVDPCTAIAAQYTNLLGIQVFATHQVKGGTRELLDILHPLYGDHVAGVNICGDYNGNKEDAAAVSTNYEIIKDRFHLSDLAMQYTRKANARHKFSRIICNDVFFKIPVQIVEQSNKVLIMDLETGQTTNQGKLLKDRENHKQDAGDAWRYFNNAIFKSVEDINNAARFINAA